MSRNPDLYLVIYRDFNSFIEIPLSEFVKISENFEVIPSSRIFSIRKENQILYLKHHLNEIICKK